MTWKPFNQPDTLTRGGASTSFTYGPDLQRIVQNNGSETVYYASESHEYRVVNGEGQHIHYLIGPFGRMGEVTVNAGTVTEARYFHHDHLGSVDTISLVDGTAVPQSYDPWGERRSATTWQPGIVSSIERRGFTDHEELDGVRLIDMNGRIYDPHLGRFLSVDPVYDRMYETQGVDAYSYVRNNPVSYTDPTGMVTSDPSWAGVESTPATQMSPFTVNGFGWDFTRQFGQPGASIPMFTGIGDSSTSRTIQATLNSAFNNGALTLYSANWFMPTSDPVRPDQVPWLARLLTNAVRSDLVQQNMLEARGEQVAQDVSDYGWAGVYINLPIIESGFGTVEMWHHLNARTLQPLSGFDYAIRSLDALGSAMMVRGGMQLAAERGAARTLIHYTNEKGLAGILESKELNPSLWKVGTKDVRYGNGQYLSDIVPGTKTPAQLSREFLNQPFQGARFTHYIEIDVSDLTVVKGRPGVFVIPNNVPLNLSGRIISHGAVPVPVTPP